ncbi:MAG: hypothetical protein IKT32_07535 [Clostridia bacterium]|jgi:hypothetical protein|nr:hypothetical protein [Clostridia bacterium]
MNPSQIKLRCMIIIAKRGLGDAISNLVKDYAHFQSIILGRGTASSEIKSALGLYEPEKDIVYCFIEQHNVKYVFSLIEENFEFTRKHLGIAMTIPVSSVDGISSFKILTGNN